VTAGTGRLATGMPPWASQLGSLSEKEQGTSDRSFDRNTIARTEFETVTPLLFKGVSSSFSNARQKRALSGVHPISFPRPGGCAGHEERTRHSSEFGRPSSDQHGGTPHDDGAAVGGQVSHTGGRLTAD
jgi:hypothetical protein